MLQHIYLLRVMNVRVLNATPPFVQMFKLNIQMLNVQIVNLSKVQMLKCSNVKYQMSIINKVKLLSERTSGLPPVIFINDLFNEPH